MSDGLRVDVLVPKVYLTMDQNKINQSGSLIAGQSIDLNMSGDFVNQGTVAGRDIVSLKANNINNLSGMISGNRVDLTAQENILIQGGSVLADTQLALKAGNDVTVESTLYETKSASNSRTDIKRGAGLYVQNAEGTLSVQSGNDINIKAAHIVNAGENGKTQLIAGGDINIGVVTTNVTESTRQDDKNYLHDSRTKDVGSSIATQGDLLVKANNTINIVGSDLNSESGKVTLSGDQGINIREGREELDFAEGHYHKDKGTLGSSSREVAYADQNNTSISSNITGKEIVMLSKEDINIQGSQVIADQNVTLDAGQNINITASEDNYYHDQREIKKKSGLMVALVLRLVVLKSQQNKIKQMYHIQAPLWVA